MEVAHKLWLVSSNYAKDSSGQQGHEARVHISYFSHRTGVVGEIKI